MTYIVEQCLKRVWPWVDPLGWDFLIIKELIYRIVHYKLKINQNKFPESVIITFHKMLEEINKNILFMKEQDQSL